MCSDVSVTMERSDTIRTTLAYGKRLNDRVPHTFFLILVLVSYSFFSKHAFHYVPKKKTRKGKTTKILYTSDIRCTMYIARALFLLGCSFVLCRVWQTPEH